MREMVEVASQEALVDPEDLDPETESQGLAVLELGKKGMEVSADQAVSEDPASRDPEMGSRYLVILGSETMVTGGAEVLVT